MYILLQFQAFVKMDEWRYVMTRKHFLLHFMSDDGVEYVFITRISVKYKCYIPTIHDVVFARFSFLYRFKFVFV